ncbi:MAG: hypothetical protein ACE5E4_06265 [Candidatus Binatia bacterium]
MKRISLTMLLVAVMLAFPVREANAQLLFDHLKCYKVKDNAKFVAEATLTALQAQFGVQDCAIKGRAKMFCVPADKQVTKFSDRTKPPLTPASFPGQELSDDRICYRLKCPKVAIQPETVTDQFGTRDVEKFKPMMLCTPAYKGAPATTTTTAPPATTTTTTTTTVQQDFPPCEGVSGPLCDGTCPAGLMCVEEPPGSGACTCAPSTPQEICGFVGPPFCWGECAPNQACAEHMGGCMCMP